MEKSLTCEIFELKLNEAVRRYCWVHLFSDSFHFIQNLTENKSAPKNLLRYFYELKIPEICVWMRNNFFIPNLLKPTVCSK